MIGPKGSGSSSHGKISFTETWRSSRPAATSCIAIIAANDFEIDPMWKRVSGRTAVPAATSAKPRHTTPSTSSPSVTASAKPALCDTSR